ncbi:amidophosphoribosyltransferase, partial [Pseudomonas aeruginosa]
MCGIVGIVGKSNVNQPLYDALTVLQHRRQDAAGIVPCHDDQLYLRTDTVLVLALFQHRHLQRPIGSLCIGHLRYPTPASPSPA